MLTQFDKDLQQARRAEYLALSILQEYDKERSYSFVGDQREYYHKGDIKAVAADGTISFFEIKNDSRIGETHNVLCEDGNLFFNTG